MQARSGATSDANTPDSASNSNVTLTLSPSLINLSLGESATIEPIATENGTPFSPNILWESTVLSIADVNSSGLVTGNAWGAPRLPPGFLVRAQW